MIHRLAGTTFRIFWVPLVSLMISGVAFGQSSASKKNLTMRNMDYPISTYFDWAQDGSVLLPMEFEYDLTVDQGMTLKVGPVTLNENTFFFQLGKLTQLLPTARGRLGDEAATEAFLVRWPDGLFKLGTLEMISRSGQTVWKYEITQADLDAWNEKIKKWSTGLGKNARTLALRSQFGLVNPKEKGAPFDTLDEGFRFCLIQGKDPYVSRLCSDRYIVRTEKKQKGLARDSAVTPTRVLLQNEEAPGSGQLVINSDVKTVQFYADLASGISYEFTTLSPKLNIADISETKNANVMRVLGWDVFPFNQHRVIRKENYSKLTKALGFQSTIKDERQFWEAALKVDRPVFYFPGSGGGVFRQRFDLGKVPPSVSRAYLHKDTPKGTYSSSITLRGRKNATVTVDSKEFSVKQDPKDKTLFEWDFKSPEQGEIGYSYFDIGFQEKNYRSYFEMYRAFANELSGRFTGVYQDGTLLYLVEGAYNHWFESLLGWDNYWVSRHRWGLSAKYFKSLNQVPVDTAGTTAALETTVVDMKYRLTPGMWTRDETIGAIASYQDFKFGDLATPMIGVGAFWARSMPAVFDRLFNYLPLMEYPKWVDMEFIYYTTPLKSKITLTQSYALNFHGQVLWRKSIFGEAGFGMKRYAFSDLSTNRKAELNTFYGTLGLGIKF